VHRKSDAGVGLVHIPGKGLSANYHSCFGHCDHLRRRWPSTQVIDLEKQLETQELKVLGLKVKQYNACRHVMGVGAMAGFLSWLSGALSSAAAGSPILALPGWAVGAFTALVGIPLATILNPAINELFKHSNELAEAQALHTELKNKQAEAKALAAISPTVSMVALCLAFIATFIAPLAS
jgi:hypothetical protein